MKVLLAAATGFEIGPLIKKYTSGLAPDTGLYRKAIRIKSLRIDILITGPGINNATYHITEALQKKYDLCIQAGIGGAFGNRFKKGEVVQVVKEKFAQSGAEDDQVFVDIFELGLIKKNAFPYSNGWLVNGSKFNYTALKSLKKVKGITVEKVHGNTETISAIENKYHPQTESMEGASFFYCCLMKQIPFLELRAISNYVEKRNKANWNISLAVTALNRVTEDLIIELSK